VENLSEARQSFKMLTEAAPPDSVDVWTATIEEAEAAQSKSPQLMDVMHSKIKTGQTLKAIRAAITEEDAAAATVSADGNSTTDWLLEGFHIEDEQ
jgi:hypothetical protein